MCLLILLLIIIATSYSTCMEFNIPCSAAMRNRGFASSGRLPESLFNAVLCVL